MQPRIKVESLKIPKLVTNYKVVLISFLNIFVNSIFPPNEIFPRPNLYQLKKINSVTKLFQPTLVNSIFYIIIFLQPTFTTT